MKYFLKRFKEIELFPLTKDIKRRYNVKQAYVKNRLATINFKEEMK